jgi:HD superfamily phosphodiesterase
MISTQKTSINQLCSGFVSETCKDRDPSHGHDHMKQVKENSMIIYHGENINDPYIKNLCRIVAWLHDVADHKYDKNNQLETIIKNFLFEHFPEDAKLIWDIIQRISYSKEVKQGRSDWLSILGEKGCIVRNIVSDADKLEAIGKIGMERCIDFSKEQYQHKNNGENMPSNLLIEAVSKHADEKLLRLKDEFIITKTGKCLAESLHNDMINILENLSNYI